MACVEALALGADLNEQRIVMASDCLEVINNLHDDRSPSYGVLLKEIKVPRRGFTKVVFNHERREHNFEAHGLAKSVFALSFGRHIWFQPPQATKVIDGESEL